jgi:hypothetical protein
MMVRSVVSWFCGYRRETGAIVLRLSRFEQVIQDYQRQTRYASEAAIVCDEEGATHALRGGKVQRVGSHELGCRAQASGFPQDAEVPVPAQGFGRIVEGVVFAVRPFSGRANFVSNSSGGLTWYHKTPKMHS